MVSVSHSEDLIAVSGIIFLILHAVSPVLMVAYAGLGLETENTAIPHIWFGIAAARVLRKVYCVVVNVSLLL